MPNQIAEQLLFARRRHSPNDVVWLALQEKRRSSSTNTVTVEKLLCRITSCSLGRSRCQHDLVYLLSKIPQHPSETVQRRFTTNSNIVMGRGWSKFHTLSDLPVRVPRSCHCPHHFKQKTMRSSVWQQHMKWCSHPARRNAMSCRHVCPLKRHHGRDSKCSVTVLYTRCDGALHSSKCRWRETQLAQAIWEPGHINFENFSHE